MDVCLNLPYLISEITKGKALLACICFTCFENALYTVGEGVKSEINYFLVNIAENHNRAMHTFQSGRV